LVAPLPVLYPRNHAVHAPPEQFIGDRTERHPERPERLDALLTGLKSGPMGIDLQAVERLASMSELMAVHASDYLEHLASLSGSMAGEPDRYVGAYVFPTAGQRATLQRSEVGRHGAYCFDTLGLVGAGTWQAATCAAACALDAAKLLLDGRAPMAYAVVRPPGHHAGPSYCGGYCYLNNAALAARTLATGANGAVLDLDYHHGNGTQDIFWEDSSVWTGSIHADPAVDYPFASGYTDEVGAGRRRGANVNVPLPLGATPDRYLEALDGVLERLVSFRPAWVVVAMGYDTFAGDTEGGFALDTNAYTEISRRLAQLALPLLIVQEGGYHTESLGELARRFMVGLGNGD